MNDYRQPLNVEISRLVSLLSRDTSESRTLVAALRKTNGKSVSDSPDVWSILYRNESTLKGEKRDEAVLGALSIFASHKRGNPAPHAFTSEGGLSVGKTLACIRAKQSNPEAFDKKVSGLLSTTTFRDALRRLYNLLLLDKSLTLDYALLANELYEIQVFGPKRVFLNWGKTYYGNSTSSITTTDSTTKGK